VGDGVVESEVTVVDGVVESEVTELSLEVEDMEDMADTVDSEDMGGVGKGRCANYCGKHAKNANKSSNSNLLLLSDSILNPCQISTIKLIYSFSSLKQFGVNFISSVGSSYFVLFGK
jgi:hypothetical protein